MDRYVKSTAEKRGKNSKHLIFAKKTDELAREVEVELKFNNNNSVFSEIEKLYIDDNQMVKFVKTLISNGKYYTNLTKGIQILQTKSENRLYYISSEISKVKWKLLNESKNICGFKCFKAVYYKNIAGKSRKIIAWYSPEIPFSIGPKDYVGSLPGLIMELDEPIARFRCSRIIINPKKEISVEWPKDINTITEDEYKKEGDKLYKKIKS